MTFIALGKELFTVISVFMHKIIYRASVLNNFHVTH